MEDIKIQRTEGVYGTTYFWEDSTGYRISIEGGPESILSANDIIDVLKERVEEYLQNA